MSEVKITKELLEHLLDLVNQGFEVTRYVADGKEMVYNISETGATTIIPEQTLIENLKYKA